MYTGYDCQRYGTDHQSSYKFGGERTESPSYRSTTLTQNTRRVLPNPRPNRDLPNLEDKAMGNSLQMREKSPQSRRKYSSSNSVSHNFEHGVDSSDPIKFAGKSSYDTSSTLNSNVKVRRNSSDSGYNSSGKVTCETRTETSLPNRLQRLNLDDNKSCGKSYIYSQFSKNKSCTSVLPSYKPELYKPTESSGRSSSRSSSRTSLDLDNTKPRSYVNDRSKLTKSVSSTAFYC